MKKSLVWVLTLALLCCSLAAVAETASTEAGFSFEGVWVEFAEENVKLYLPTEWIDLLPTAEQHEESVRTETEHNGHTHENGPIAYYGLQEGGQLLILSVHPGDGSTLETMLEAMRPAEDVTNAAIVTLGGFSFLTYQIDGMNMYGALAISADGEHIYDFVFSPTGDETVARATQILSSFSAIGE